MHETAQRLCLHALSTWCCTVQQRTARLLCMPCCAPCWLVSSLSVISKGACGVPYAVSLP